MNEQLSIQRLKQLPRVGQGGDASKFQTREERAAAAGLDPVGGNSAIIDTAKLTIAGKLMQELNTQASSLTTLLSLTVGSVERLNKSLGTTSAQSKAIFDNFRIQNEALRDINISDTQRIKQAEVLATIIPGQLSNLSALEGASREILDFQTQAVVQAGANEAAVAKFNKLLLISGENTSNVRDNLLNSAKAIQLATGETSVFRDMLNAVGAVSSATRQEFRGTTEELAEAAFQATRMGTTLDEVRTASAGYLNIESSIQKELEAQLMTGINMASEMNQIRSASYTGDYDEVLRIQNKLIEENFEAIKQKGPLAMRSFAASLNLTDEQLSNQYETIKATNAVIEQSGKRTLGTLATSVAEAETAAARLASEAGLTDEQTEQLKKQQEQLKKQKEQLNTFKELVAASNEFRGMNVEDIELRQILEVPELQESFEELIVSTGKIQDTRDAPTKLAAAQEGVTDAIGGAYSADSFAKLISSLDATTNKLYSKIDDALSGKVPPSLADAFTSLTTFITGEFQTSLTSTIETAALDGFKSAAEKSYGKLSDLSQASSKK